MGPHLGSPPDPYLSCTPCTPPNPMCAPQPYTCPHVLAPHVSCSPPPAWVRPAGGKEQNMITRQ